MADEDDSSSFSEIAMMAVAAVPVLGAMVSAPIVGSGLASLAILDSLLILIRGY